MSFTVQINVALRERICQKIGSERVNEINITIKSVLWGNFISK